MQLGGLDKKKQCEKKFGEGVLREVMFNNQTPLSAKKKNPRELNPSGST